MKYFYTFLLLFASAHCLAQSKIDLQGQMMLKEYKNSSVANVPLTTLTGDKSLLSVPAQRTESGAAPVVTAIVTLSDGATAEDLRNAGYEVTADLNSMALVKVSIDKTEKMSELKAVRRISFGTRHQLFLDKARAASNADAAHTGIDYNGETHTYTGKGVVTGIYDIGIAPNHVNFKNSDGTSRVKKLYYYPNDSTRYTLPAEYIAQWTCEDSTQTHGTHTLGIMAGGYKGTASVAIENLTTGKATTTSKANPYYGLATESDIVISCGELWDATTVDGMYQMGMYAKENGQPIVINYSAGSPMGPHDGTDAFSQALAEISDQTGAIICLSAGNFGSDKMSIEKTFSSTTDKAITCVTPPSGYPGCYAYLDFWSDDARPFSIKVSSYKPALFLGNGTDTEIFTISAANQYYDYASVNATGVTYSSDLKSAFTEAEIIAISEVDQINKRYHTLVLVYYYRNSYNSFLHLELTGSAGQHIFGTLTQIGEFTAQSKISGSIDGNGDNSISDPCTNPALISIGSYDTRQYYGRLDGAVYGLTSGFNEGGVTSFSSYGPAFDGTQLPNVIAPGNIIISSYNPYYVEQSTDDGATTMSAKVTSGGKNYYWGTMSGTSMSCPYVAGTIALWLEADPMLTTAEIKDIMAKTSIQDAGVNTDPEKAGYGKIDVEAGLREILARNELNGVTDPTADPEKNLIISQSGEVIDIFLAGADCFTATLYDIQGRTVAEATANGSEMSLSTGVAKGIYILAINSEQGKITRKIILK